MGNRPVKLNIGCGSAPLPGYVNIDSDDLDTLRSRYPSRQFDESIKIFQYDIFNLPFEDNSVAEVQSYSLIEHLSFLVESRFFREIKRVLMPRGEFVFSTPDFEKVFKIWLEARYDWKEFYRNDEEAIRREHWFGQYSYSLDSRWGYLAAILYGPQNSEGQFHKNCYTAPKIKAICQFLDFEEPKIEKYMWKGDRVPMLQVSAIKK